MNSPQPASPVSPLRPASPLDLAAATSRAAGRAAALAAERAAAAKLLPAAVLFDMDGTLVDSEKVWEVALKELAISAGGVLTPAARQAMIGASMANSMAILRDDLGQPDRPEGPDIAWLTNRVFELFEQGLVWRPGAFELLSAVRRAGLPTALVTATERKLTEVALDTLGRENFDVVVCGDEVPATKPDPEPYLTAARLLGVAIENCVAVEDSVAGMASAIASGAAVLAVPAELELSPADGVHLRTTLEGVDLAYLARLLTREPFQPE